MDALMMPNLQFQSLTTNYKRYTDNPVSGKPLNIQSTEQHSKQGSSICGDDSLLSASRRITEDLKN